MVHNELLRKDIHRLVETAKSEMPHLSKCTNGFDVTSTTSFEKLSLLVSRIASDCFVVALDNHALCIANNNSISVVDRTKFSDTSTSPRPSTGLRRLRRSSPQKSHEDSILHL